MADNMCSLYARPVLVVRSKRKTLALLGVADGGARRELRQATNSLKQGTSCGPATTHTMNESSELALKQPQEQQHREKQRDATISDNEQDDREQQETGKQEGISRCKRGTS